jgi:hypothetical protein
MDTHFYLRTFQSALASRREESLHDPDLLYFAGPVLGAIALKIYKAEWASDPQEPLTAPARIFFSVWVTARSVQQQQLLYNIHALKLRQLKGYKIPSRDFAAQFRTMFQPLSPEWPNLSLDHGPLTLMQGWMPLDPKTLETDTTHLIRQFETISPLIDQALQLFKAR